MSDPMVLISKSTHKKNAIGSNRKVIGVSCPKHGFVSGDHCPKCREEHAEVAAVHTHDWVRGVWEHIDKEPIYIESKEHLFRECEKRGVIPRAFMKPKSRGAGFEIKR